MRASVPLLLLLFVVPMLAACASAPSPALDEREFLSTAVSENGAAKALVPGTRVRISLRDGQFHASVGCNSMSGAYVLANGRLMVDDLGMTEMGCDPQRHAQDEWLAAFLVSRPSLELTGNDLLLQGGGIAMRLVDRRVAEPDLPVVGTFWTVEALIVFDGVSTVPPGVVATLQLRPDGGFDVATGCNQGSGRYAVAGETIRFTDLGLTRMACLGAAGQMETHFLRILGADAVALEIEAQALTLQAGEFGVVLRGQ